MRRRWDGMISTEFVSGILPYTAVITLDEQHDYPMNVLTRTFRGSVDDPCNTLWATQRLDGFQ